jgi:hypothetical protein
VKRQESQMSAMVRTAAMISGELKPVRMALRSLPPDSDPRSASSSRKVSRLPICMSLSTTAAFIKKT